MQGTVGLEAVPQVEGVLKDLRHKIGHCLTAISAGLGEHVLVTDTELPQRPARKKETI